MPTTVSIKYYKQLSYSLNRFCFSLTKPTAEIVGIVSKESGAASVGN